MEGEMKYVSTAEMLAVEKEADANGLTYEMMMEHAGVGLAEQVAAKCSDQKDGGVLGLVGSGNNGGDTLVALAKMVEWGWHATAYIVRERPSGDPLVERLIANGGLVLDIGDDPKLVKLKSALTEHSVLMDGVLGTGIKLPLRGKVKEVLGKTKGLLSNLIEKPIVIAVDCPSGVDCDTGEASPHSLTADFTVTMAAIKRGLLEFPANDLIGELILVGIGLEDDDQRSQTWQGIRRRVANSDWIRNKLPVRKRDAHKGTFGTALIVAGSVNYTGAVLLAGKAAYRSGVGLVTLGVPSPLHSALAGHIPEATWLLLPHEIGVIDNSASEVVLKNLEKVTGMLLGPGFGMEETTKEFLADLLAASPHSGKASIGFVSAMSKASTYEKRELPPLIVDADGLKLLSKIPEWPEKLPRPAILTPHPGEMSVLTGLEVSEIQNARIETAEKFAKEWGHVLVLKGANTVIANPDGVTIVIPVANPALARAGSGDVLAGIITGLRAQGLNAFEAAVSGSWIHAQSGIKSAEIMGTTSSVLAGDLLKSMNVVIQELEGG
jgi:NAD(P)H-hydrate epimerase